MKRWRWVMRQNSTSLIDKRYWTMLCMSAVLNWSDRWELWSDWFVDDVCVLFEIDFDVCRVMCFRNGRRIMRCWANVACRLKTRNWWYIAKVLLILLFFKKAFNDWFYISLVAGTCWMDESWWSYCNHHWQINFVVWIEEEKEKEKQSELKSFFIENLF